jgi:hypothetical protein
MKPTGRRPSGFFCLATLVACLWAVPSTLATGSTVLSADPGSGLRSSTDAVGRRTLPDPTGPGPDATSGATDPLPTPTPSISVAPDDATDPISDAIRDATDAVSGTASGEASDASGARDAITGSGSGVAGPGVTGTADTSAREGQGRSGCAQACRSGGSSGPLAQAVERVLGFLAETGVTLLPWIGLAVGLAAVGIALLRASKRRASGP